MALARSWTCRAAYRFRQAVSLGLGARPFRLQPPNPPRRGERAFSLLERDLSISQRILRWFR